MSPESDVSRRTVLKTTGGSLLALGTTGLASADPDDLVRVNVGFKSDRGRRAALDAADEVVRQFNFDALTIRVPRQAATALADRPGVRYVETNGQMQALAQTLPWGIDRVDAEIAHANGDTGAGADIAIVDTGIDTSHPDLQDNLGWAKAFVPCDSSCSQCGPCEVPWDDDNGHGTHVAGIAGAIDNTEGVVGVGPGVTLHAVKVLDCQGRGSYSDISAGIEYAADRGCDVVILCFGGSHSLTLYDAVRYAYNRGVLLVAAAGNDGPCTDCVAYPAAYDEVVAVCATSSDDSLSSFSSTGPEVELAAPGSGIYSTMCTQGYDTYSGTSMAAPHVAGAGGQLMAHGYTNVEARHRLQSTAEDIGLSSNEQGYGLVDAAAALGHYSGDN